MDYNQFSIEHRRLTILTLLNAQPTYTAPEGVVKGLLAQRGHPVGIDSLRADLQWLHEQGLVLVKKEPEGFWLATLTAHGGDVKDGLSTMPGVARPEPR